MTPHTNGNKNKNKNKNNNNINKNKNKNKNKNNNNNNNEMPSTSSSSCGAANERPEPRLRLFQESLDHAWSRTSMAKGLSNHRNSCYVNSILQCMHHVPAFNSYLEGQHQKECRLESSKCVTCMLTRLSRRCFGSAETATAVEPSELVSSVGSLTGGHLTPGKQEDAHDFFHSLVNKMLDGATQGLRPKADQYVELTTAVGQIFGGFLRSEVLCFGCGRASTSYEQMLSLSLDIDGIDRIERALERFFKAERMDTYKCPGCAGFGRTAKSYSIDAAPACLAIHLKRYDRANKLDHKVDFDSSLDLTSHLWNGRGAATYELCGVVVHQGSRIGCGHYYAYVSDPASRGRDCGGVWYKMNDSIVNMTSWEEIKGCQAYVMFYVRKDTCLVQRESASAIASRAVVEDILALFRKCKEENRPYILR